MVLKKHVLSASFLCATLTIGYSLTACDPIPRHTLTSEEKVADMYWIYSQFGENYAPLDLKQKLYNFDYEKLKTDYVELAKQTKTNDEFYDLMFKFVAEFRDAHTSAALTNASLPNRATVAFLGFNGIRKGDKFVVKDLLPTITTGTSYPIKPGDVIVKFNHKSLKDAVTDEQLAFRNLGSDEANYTALMNRLFTRVSTTNGSPTDANAVVTVERTDLDAKEKALSLAQLIQDPTDRRTAIDAANHVSLKKEVNITLPWVVKDLSVFKKQQADAVADKTKKTDAEIAAANPDANFLMVDGEDAKQLKFNFIGFDGRVQMPFDLIQRVTANVRKKISDSFIFLDNYASWNLVADGAAPKTSADNLKANRAIMKNAMFIPGSDTYPAYVAPRDVLDANGDKTGEKKLIGYIYIDTFSPSAAEPAVVAEVKQTLAAFQNLGVKDLIIDTINNGGGSLVLGMKLAQALTNKVVAMPKMQVRLSDTWLDEYEQESLQNTSDAEAEFARRTLNTLRDQQKANPDQRLSAPLGADELLAPFEIQPNEDLIQPFNTVLLVNEMCASMCDIFAGIVQDNGLAKIVGTNTMGAGGNVVNHTQAPNSHLDVRQTESLMVRGNGDYIENKGVKPDVEIAVNESSDSKYDQVLLKAIDLIVNKKAASTPTVKPAAPSTPAPAPKQPMASVSVI